MSTISIIFLLLASFVFNGSIAAQSTVNDRPRVFIEETESWEVEGDDIWTSVDKKGRTTVGGGGTRGGAKPRTAETIKRFNEQCRDVVITMYKEKADFIVLMEHEGGKDLFNKDNKLAVFNREGDLIASGSFSRPRKAVETACGAIQTELRRQVGSSPNDQ